MQDYLPTPTQFSHLEFWDGSIVDLPAGLSCQQLAAWMDAHYPGTEIGYKPEHGVVWENDHSHHIIATIHYV